MLKNLKTFLFKNKIILMSLALLGTFFAGFSLSGDLYIFLFLFPWIFLGLLYKFEEKVYFGLALIFLAASLVAFLLNKQFLSEKMAIWEFIFIITGIVWGLVSLARK